MRERDEVRFDLRTTRDGGVMVHATSHVIEDAWDETASAADLAEILRLRNKLVEHTISDSGLVRLGLLLGATLVPGSIRQALIKRIAGTTQSRLVIIRVVVHNAALAELPWEFARLDTESDQLGGIPLTLDERVSLVRSPLMNTAVRTPVFRGATDLRVLHGSATKVSGYAELSGDENAIEQALWGTASPRSRRIVVDRLSDPFTRSDLKEALVSQPDVFVFSGHAPPEPESGLVLAAPDGSSDTISSEDLADLLESAGTSLVVLNACDTANTRAGSPSLVDNLVVRGIDTVVGMQMRITDGNASQFAIGLISSLAEGRSVDEAVVKGRKRVADRASYAEWGVPVLMRGIGVDESQEVPPAGFQQGLSPEEGLLPVPVGPSGIERAAEPASSGATPPKKLIAGVVAVLLVALMVGGFVLAGGDDGGEESAGAEPQEPTPTTEDEPSGSIVDEPIPAGVANARLLEGTSIKDTSPALEAMLERMRTTSAFSEEMSAEPLGRLDAKFHKWPGSPAISDYGATNGISAECNAVLLHDLVVTGVAGGVWKDPNGTIVLINLVETGDKEMARSYYWATSLFNNPDSTECDGWPEGGTAVDPTELSVDHMDFPIDVPVDLALTRVAHNETHFGIDIAIAYDALIQAGNKTAALKVGSTTGDLNADDAKAALESFANVLAGG